jgi:SAM-dependent methyltransferase
MDRWKFYDITHRDHLICNPTSSAKLDELIALLDLPRGAHVLDIGCGKAEFLVRLVEHYDCVATGVDMSPFFINAAREKALVRVPDANLTLIEQDGADYEGRPASFDMTACLGASWIYGGYAGTLRALAALTKPGGQVVSGEPFVIGDPPDAFFERSGFGRHEFGSHAANVATGAKLGLRPLYALVSNHDDWDRYEGLQWRAAEHWAGGHPHDPDRAELLEKIVEYRDVYLTGGRNYLGWALYLFRKPHS